MLAKLPEGWARGQALVMIFQVSELQRSRSLLMFQENKKFCTYMVVEGDLRAGRKAAED